MSAGGFGPLGNNPPSSEWLAMVFSDLSWNQVLGNWGVSSEFVSDLLVCAKGYEVGVSGKLQDREPNL